MIRSKTLPALLAATLLATTAAPAFAVSIRHTNRAGGDPDAAMAATGHTSPPVDTTPAHALDKAHEGGGVR